MNKVAAPRLGHSYRVDIRNGIALCAIESNERIDFAEVSPGTEFTTKGSTPMLREQKCITHATHLVLHFDERAVPYFCTENDAHIEIASCEDLRLTVVDIPYMGH